MTLQRARAPGGSQLGLRGDPAAAPCSGAGLRPGPREHIHVAEGATSSETVSDKQCFRSEEAEVDHKNQLFVFHVPASASVRPVLTPRWPAPCARPFWFLLSSPHKRFCVSPQHPLLSPDIPTGGSRHILYVSAVSRVGSLIFQHSVHVSR